MCLEELPFPNFLLRVPCAAPAAVTAVAVAAVLLLLLLLLFPRTMCCYFCERAAEHYSFIFDRAPCTAAIFQNELSNCIF